MTKYYGIKRIIVYVTDYFVLAFSCFLTVSNIN